MIVKRDIFRGTFAVWALLWMFFLVREGKKNQYADLKYMYTHGYTDKVRYLLGEDLADLLSLSAIYLPEGATYDIEGFKRFSIDEVRARYYLWPFMRVAEDPDFIIVYGGLKDVPDGYDNYVSAGSSGRILKRKDIL